MNGEPGTKGVPHGSADKEIDPLLRDPRVLAWFDENLTDLRRIASGQGFLYWSLGIGFVIGLAAHVGGYLLTSSVTTEPLALAADLLYALGWALWTGVVVVVFVQILPEAKRRQVRAGARCLRGSASRQGPSLKRPGVGVRPSADGNTGA